MSEAFHILNEEGIIDPELKDRLSRMVGFRNVMAHDYEEIDYAIVYDVLHAGLADIEEFLNNVKTVIS